MISGNNEAKRVQWCTNDFPAIVWQSVVFSDEANISLNRNKVNVWTKYPEENPFADQCLIYWCLGEGGHSPAEQYFI